MRDIPVSFSVVGKVDLPVYQLKVHTAIHIYARFMAYENIKGRKLFNINKAKGLIDAKLKGPFDVSYLILIHIIVIILPYLVEDNKT